MRHFIIVADKPTIVQQNAITDVVKGRYGYWHWIYNVWLLADAFNLEGITELRDKINKAAPGCSFKIFQVQPETWAGYSPTNWADWLNKNWTKQ